MFGGILPLQLGGFRNPNNFFLIQEQLDQKLEKMNQKLKIFWKYIEFKADWKMQLGIPLTVCNDHGHKGCLKSYWYSF